MQLMPALLNVKSNGTSDGLGVWSFGCCGYWCLVISVLLVILVMGDFGCWCLVRSCCWEMWLLVILAVGDLGDP